MILKGGKSLVNGNERRANIVELLLARKAAVTGAELAKIYGVSRQAIVQDIALIRAQGVNILASPQGYLMMGEEPKRLRKTIVSSHSTLEGLLEELYVIVDYGGQILDVIVEHPIYGEIRANLMIKSRLEADQFLMSLKKHQAVPLSILTNGIHLHTIEVDNELLYEKIVAALKDIK